MQGVSRLTVTHEAGPTFVKTFMRTYADYLGLDSRLLVEEYKQRFERPAGIELTPLNLRRQARRRRLGPRLGPGIVVVVGVIALLSVLYVLGRQQEEGVAAAMTANLLIYLIPSGNPIVFKAFPQFPACPPVTA